MKVLVFTCSNQRPHMLRQCILSIRNQSYENIVHSVNLTLRKNCTTTNYDMVYEDLIDKKTIISYSENVNQNTNHLTAIKNIPDYESYDLFVKVDDDDIYKKDYIKNIVSFFENDNSVDVTSSKAKYQLNGFDIYQGNYKNLGANPANYEFNMPPTFAFNKKALASIINPTNQELVGYADMKWRNAWSKNNLVHKEIDNTSQWIWHIHGKNMTTSSFLKTPKI